MKQSDLLLTYIIILINGLSSVYSFWPNIASRRIIQHVKKSDKSSYNLKTEVEFLTTSRTVSRQELSFSNDSVYSPNLNKSNARNGQYLLVAPMYSVCCCSPQTLLIPTIPSGGEGGGGSMPAGSPALSDDEAENGEAEEVSESEENGGEEEEEEEEERRVKQRRLKKGKKKTKNGAQIRKVSQNKAKRRKRNRSRRKHKSTKQKSSTSLSPIV